MTISLLQHIEIDDNSGTNIAAAFTPSAGSNRFILFKSINVGWGPTTVVSAATFGSAAITSIGYLHDDHGNGSQCHWWGYLKEADIPSGSQTVSIDWNEGAVSGGYVEVWGDVDQTSPFAGFNTQSIGASAGSPAALSFGSVASGKAVSLFSSQNSGTVPVAPSGYTASPAGPGSGTNCPLSAYKILTSTGTESPTFTFDGTSKAGQSGVVINGAASGATLSSPTTPSIGTTTATLGATTTNGTAGSNNIYGVWSTSNVFSGVTGTQVKAGQNASGSTSGVSASGIVAVTSTSPTISVTGLTANTTYYFALVENDVNGDSNVVTGSFTTSAVTTSFSLGMLNGSDAAVASISLSWFLMSTWGGAVLASGTTSTDSGGSLTVSGLSQAAGTYKLFYKLASDETQNGMHLVDLV